MKKHIEIDDFKADYIGKNIYELEKSPTPYITLTGSEVSQEIKIPFGHRLVRLDIKHCDSSDDDATSQLTWSFKRQLSKTLDHTLKGYVNSTETHFPETFGEAYEFTNMLYKLVAVGTDTDRLYFKLTIQVLEFMEQ